MQAGVHDIGARPCPHGGVAGLVLAIDADYIPCNIERRKAPLTFLGVTLLDFDRTGPVHDVPVLAVARPDGGCQDHAVITHVGAELDRAVAAAP